jgi:O-acetyl-ADP-ribose deacetylase (regulator of RNase III)
MSLNFHKGSALEPIGTGNKIIVHICNTVGAWGGGFTKPLTRHWTQPKRAYKSLRDKKLGTVQFVKVEPDITVANVIGQVFHYRNGPPIRYHAVRTALKTVAKRCNESNASVHMPRIGCGLAGGSWNQIEPIIIDELVKSEVSVNVYDL